jgi:phage I-like protein
MKSRVQCLAFGRKLLRSATFHLLSRLTLATCDSALPPGSDVPEWVHLLPVGHIVARDGREFDLSDPAAVILAFQEGGIGLPVDYEHQNDRPEAKLKGPVPAAGWIKELAHNESGLWGRVEWTATAREMISRREYRFLSPSFLHNKAGRIMRLSGAGLVHNPALHLKALARQERPMLEPKTTVPTGTKPNPEPSPGSQIMERLWKLLKLSPDATEEEALDALEAWLSDLQTNPDPKKFVPVEAVAEMQRERHLEKATMAEGQAVEKVNAAMRAGYFPPGLRDWALALCKSDAAAFDTFLTKSGPVYSYLSKPALPGSPPDHKRSTPASEAEAAICAMLGLKPEQLATG